MSFVLHILIIFHISFLPRCLRCWTGGRRSPYICWDNEIKNYWNLKHHISSHSAQPYTDAIREGHQTPKHTCNVVPTLIRVRRAISCLRSKEWSPIDKIVYQEDPGVGTDRQDCLSRNQFARCQEEDDVDWRS